MCTCAHRQRAHLCFETTTKRPFNFQKRWSGLEILCWRLGNVHMARLRQALRIHFILKDVVDVYILGVYLIYLCVLALVIWRKAEFS